VILGLDLLPFRDAETAHYPTGSRPVFFEHYWLKGKPPLFQSLPQGFRIIFLGKQTGKPADLLTVGPALPDDLQKKRARPH
jgi:hypothetical protein